MRADIGTCACDVRVIFEGLCRGAEPHVARRGLTIGRPRSRVSAARIGASSIVEAPWGSRGARSSRAPRWGSGSRSRSAWPATATTSSCVDWNAEALDRALDDARRRGDRRPGRHRRLVDARARGRCRRGRGTAARVGQQRRHRLELRRARGRRRAHRPRPARAAERADVRHGGRRAPHARGRRRRDRQRRLDPGRRRPFPATTSTAPPRPASRRSRATSASTTPTTASAATPCCPAPSRRR